MDKHKNITDMTVGEASDEYKRVLKDLLQVMETTPNIEIALAAASHFVSNMYVIAKTDKAHAKKFLLQILDSAYDEE